MPLPLFPLTRFPLWEVSPKHHREPHDAKHRKRRVSLPDASVHGLPGGTVVNPAKMVPKIKRSQSTLDAGQQAPHGGSQPGTPDQGSKRWPGYTSQDLSPTPGPGPNTKARARTRASPAAATSSGVARRTPRKIDTLQAEIESLRRELDEQAGEGH